MLRTVILTFWQECANHQENSQIGAIVKFTEMSEICINPSENLVQLIDRLIVEKQYDGVMVLLQENRNKNHLKDVCSEVVQICVKHITEENYESNAELYMCCEELLKAVSQHATEEEVLLELLEIIETTKADITFTTALKALQICLLRLKENRARALEWSLNSIRSYLTELTIPKYLESGYDERQGKLLEQDEGVHRVLTNYITIFLFYEPLYKELEAIKCKDTYYDTTITRKNVLICFVLQLLDKPFSLLDLTNKAGTTNCHSLQCAKTISSGLSALLVDPFFLLSYVERRIRCKPKHPEDGVYELASRDIFMVDEKAPLIALAVYYYLLFVENLIPENAPKIYRNMYFFKSCLYLVVVLLESDEPPHHYKGLLLGLRLLENLGSERIMSDALDLNVHSNFCKVLIKIVVYSIFARNRRTGLQLLTKYILQFEDDGRFLLVKNIIQSSDHDGLRGYVITMYKDFVAERLRAGMTPLPEHISTKDLKCIMLNHICVLPSGIETDIMQSSQQILSSLNVVRYFIIADPENRTGFWDFLKELENNYLSPLRTGLIISRAHYKEEENRVRRNLDASEDLSANCAVSLLSGEELPIITKEDKLSMLSSAMITFDLIESLCARINECIDANTRNKAK